MANEHIYAVSRVKSKEAFLLNSNDISEMINSKNLDDLNKILLDKGFEDISKDYNEAFSKEEEKIWSFVSELEKDLSIFNTLRVQKDFHNLKAAIKETYSKRDVGSIYLKFGSIEANKIKDLISEKNFSKLPNYMSKYAQKADEYMAKTNDSQLLDITLDKGLSNSMIYLAEKSGNQLLKDYAYKKVFLSNIKIAIRGSIAKKDRSFFEKALTNLNSINIEPLINASVSGTQSLYSYLENTEFKDSIDKIKKNISYFDLFEDNEIMNLIKKVKYESFGISPIVAYILARETEIKNVRIITVAKKNEIEKDDIKKRMRDMYV